MIQRYREIGEILQVLDEDMQALFDQQDIDIDGDEEETEEEEGDSDETDLHDELWTWEQCFIYAIWYYELCWYFWQRLKKLRSYGCILGDLILWEMEILQKIYLIPSHMNIF